MYSGHLPPGLSEADLSSEDEEDDEAAAENTRGEQLSRQSDTEQLSVCVQVECNNTKTGLHNDAFGNDCLLGVSLDKWQKFKELQRAKFYQRMKEQQTKWKRHQKKGGTQNCDTGQKREPEEKREEHWKELTQYFGINDRLKPPSCSRPPHMSGLEKSIESAIAEGDYGKAEELSDRLATRELAVKIAQAADCRDFTRTKQEAEASQAARKRRKQIAWGFEAKKRWETKSNMGFM
ncbi:LOW QUALITY PROTEIN: protein FAM204A [Carassius gibelio]|uniref:LOW QUALITY PROTEIN: protein FAM204A n=1 Tax=Carassius gibelio TaxID=101364 RepID=UPI00227802D5|nr:LOW QUALITY PROTEIN: protein FAM204A [Carassius gibelio]